MPEITRTDSEMTSLLMRCEPISAAHWAWYQDACASAMQLALAWAGPVRHQKERLTHIFRVAVAERNALYESRAKDWRVIHG